MIRNESRGASARVLAVAVAAVMITAAVQAPPAVARPTDVTVTASPSTVQVNGLPCDSSYVDLSMINTTDEGRVADLVIAGTEPLRLSRDVYSTWLPAADPDQTVTAPLGVSVPRGTEAGHHDVTLTLDGAVRGTVDVEVVEPEPKGETDNLLASEQVTASSTHGSFSACALVDGNADSEDWTGSGWNDGTKGVWPDTVDVSIPEPRQISRVVLTTLDSATSPAEQFGLSDWDVQLRVDGEWTTVAEIRDNAEGQVTSTFSAIVADAVRIVAHGSNNDDDYARIVELEAFAT